MESKIVPLLHTLSILNGVAYKHKKASRAQHHVASAAPPATVAAAAVSSSPLPSPSPSPESPAPSPFILILLNQPLDAYFMDLWANASFRVCADGASNRLYRYFETDDERKCHAPHAIIGDFDSVKPDILSFYRGLKTVYVRHDTDQDTTDMEKCVNWIQQEAEAADGESIEISPTVTDWNSDLTHSFRPILRQLFATSTPVQSALPLSPQTSSANANETSTETSASSTSAASPVTPLEQSSVPFIFYPAFGGRFDQEISHLQLLYKASMKQEGKLLKQRQSSHSAASSPSPPALFTPFILLSVGNCSRILLPGYEHRIDIHPHFEGGNHAAFYPLCGPAQCVTTKGLTWDVDHAKMEWGGLISTCNKIPVTTQQVSVLTDAPLVWWTEVRPKGAEED